MRLTVRRSPLEAPLCETADAHTVELRDDDGRLQAILFFPPGLSTFIFSGCTDTAKPRFVFANANDPGFETFARGLGFALQEPPRAPNP